MPSFPRWIEVSHERADPDREAQESDTQRQAEVEDFVDFLRSCEDDQRLATATRTGSEPAFADAPMLSITAYNSAMPSWCHSRSPIFSKASSDRRYRQQ